MSPGSRRASARRSPGVGLALDSWSTPRLRPLRASRSSSSRWARHPRSSSTLGRRSAMRPSTRGSASRSRAPTPVARSGRGRHRGRRDGAPRGRPGATPCSHENLGRRDAPRGARLALHPVGDHRGYLAGVAGARHVRRRDRAREAGMRGSIRPGSIRAWTRERAASRRDRAPNAPGGRPAVRRRAARRERATGDDAAELPVQSRSPLWSGAAVALRHHDGVIGLQRQVLT